MSTFDRPAFNKLAEVKALFVQHLKQEGQILQDDDDFLGSVLNAYSPKTHYFAERNDALAQIAALPRAQGTYWHDLCLADILYVLFRNAAILHLSSDAQYCFHYPSLTSYMAQLFGLDEPAQKALLALRSLKHNYRKRELVAFPYGQLELSIKSIKNILENVKNKDISSISSGITTDNYYRMRLIELDMLKYSDPRELDMLKPNDKMFDFWQSIRQSGGYPKPRIHLH